MALHMSTILSKSSSEILSHLSRIRSSFSSQITFFALSVSSSHDASEVSSLVSHLTSLTEQSVGCLSSQLDNGMLSREGAFSCSVAVFDKSSATPFRSTVPGRQAAQVGRWHSNRRSDDNGRADAPSHRNGLHWDDVWAKNSREYALPPEIQSLQRDDLDTVIYLSDGSPEGLSNALHTLPVATSIGMIGASTPFITGRPYTLFRGNSIYSSGAVGLCLSSPSPSRSHLAFPGLQALTPPMIVTESEGNLIHSLDNTNPTRLLLAAIERAQNGLEEQEASTKAEWISKEDQFYVATLSALSNEPQQICRITSGDPSRGTLALEGDFAPSKGAPVRVYQQLANTHSSLLSQDASTQGESAISRTRFTLSLAVSPPEAANMSPSVTSDDTTIVLEDTFLAATENGLLIDRYKWQLGTFRERPWLCRVPGAVMNMCWG
ncbi:uncharacterized protein LAESUDRAFT_712239 [Laetiporus sulphureus 93-53]|uniref:FIST domain-containing protein n=1 Tax=Laetiporus sulphureus 93-53 TaxID=1314785 RepID=A0A165FK05_9APHY|nr:uncharacterized protein LAESUDRAFT_712239 [Laetiporus sulphureus 93-53]KZT09087.1 hypothetical protein LAESUDRAFT_712239 [Laetiporus sulphureus 93-53]